MAIVLCSPHRWGVLVVTIAGSMLAAADASAYDTTGKDRLAAACSTNSAGSPVPSDNSAVHDQDRLVTVDQLAAPAPVHDCSKTNDGPCVCSSQSLDNPAWRAGHRAPKTHPVRAAMTVRVVFDGGVRLTRLQSGSTPHWVDHFPDYLVTMPLDDPNDDGTSKDPDDDDTPNDLSGYHETHVPFMAWLPERAPYLIVPERTVRATGIAPPSLALLLILQRLRC